MHDELRAIVEADQADRRSSERDDFGEVAARDAERTRRVLEILASTPVDHLDGGDLFAAALVLQHGALVEHQQRAAELALLADARGHRAARWLHAAADGRVAERALRAWRP